MHRARTSLAALSLLAAVACSQSTHEPATPATTPTPNPGWQQLYCSSMDDLFVDADGDGYGDNNKPKLACPADSRVPFGYVLYAGSGYDCDDSDPTKFDTYYRDADGDGVGTSQVTVCAGRTPPQGYLADVGWFDCDDSDPTVSYAYAFDADGDGVLPAHPGTICGPKDHAPPHGSITYTYPPDCDDTDPTVWMPYYQDLDGDGCAGASDVMVCGNPTVGPPPGFGIPCDGLADCDDTRTDVNPFGFELWSDAIDSNCDGYLSPYRCGDDGSCPPAWFTVPVDPSCASADLVITDVTTAIECYVVHWDVGIANQGAETIPEYTLTVESSDGTSTYQIHDPLAPGARYPYPMPDRWLSGQVRFSVTSGAADCNPANNTVTKTAVPISCGL